MTPAELWLEFEASYAIERDVSVRQITQAWHTVRIWLMSHKKDKLQLPKLSKLLNEVRPRKGVRSRGDQFAMLHAIGKQFGIPMRDSTPDEIAAAQSVRVM